MPTALPSAPTPMPAALPRSPTPMPLLQPQPAALPSTKTPPPVHLGPSVVPPPSSLASPMAAPVVEVPPAAIAPPPLASTPPASLSSSKPCAACGYENAASVKFCGNCGKRLDGPAPASSAAPEEGAGRTMFLHAAGDLGAVKEKVCKLVTIDQTGREGMTFTIKSGETVCGRVNGVILFFDDPFVSPTHCKFSFINGVLKVIDLNSLNGVYMRVKQERRLADGELIRLGRQLFRFESMKMASFQVKKADGDDSRIWGAPAPAAFGRLVQILDDGRTGEIRLLVGERAQVGREVGDIVIPTDGFISGRHCVFTLQQGQPTLADLGSSNGTYIRVRGEAEVGHGDFVLVGNQMLRVEIV
jgi:pSer/pThr/pTyr-binding forkhead associated (FHA) protein